MGQHRGAYDREKLYEEVWKEPALVVAKRYGISSVWLGKVCRQLNVPVPPRGYWARVRSGGKGKKPPLPKLRMKPGPPGDTSTCIIEAEN